MTISTKRAKYIALISLILSVVFFGIAFFVGRWSQFFAVYSVSWLVLPAALVWFVLMIQFHTRGLAEQEKLDMGQLAQENQNATIFQAKGDHPELFNIAQHRLQLFEKWFIPGFSVIIAIYEIAIGLYLLRAAATPTQPSQSLACAIWMTGIAFVSFLISRYATGMSTELQSKPLRAGGSLFLCIAIVCFILAVGLAMAQFRLFIVTNILGYFIGGLLLALGVETALNVVLDIYRPRLQEQYSRSAFDSRLLGVINEPGEILHTAAGAIDYQFGFKVSQTWFYKLLAKAIMPLVLFAIAVLYLLSCMIIVGPDEQAIIEHYGNPLDSAGQVRIAEPGLTFKSPWPIDIAYTYPVKAVSQINIGFIPKHYEPGIAREPLLWNKGHYEAEYNLLVASEQTGGSQGPGAVPISLVRVAVPVQYRIKDLYAFIYNHDEPIKLLKSICYRELTRYAASAIIEITDHGTDNENASLLGAGRIQARKILIERIQQTADEENLGIEIVFLGLQGIHPPEDVAEDFQKVAGAVQNKQKLIHRAEAQRIDALSSIAGSVADADKLYSLAAEYQKATEANQQDKIETIGAALDQALVEAKGDIFKTLRQAQSYAFEKVTLARATGERFADQLKAYNSAKEIYLRQQRLAVLEEVLVNARKYIVVAEPNDTQVTIIDLKEKLTPDLYDLAGIEENSVK